jgi:hypothetical protein
MNVDAKRSAASGLPFAGLNRFGYPAKRSGG